MTAAVAGYGTTFQVGDAASPEVYTTVAEIVSISGPESSNESIEVTSLDSTAKEYIAALSDSGSVQLEMNWIKSSTQQINLRGDAEAGTSRNYKITWPDSPATVASFAATVESWSMGETSAGAALTASATLKVSGSVTWS